MQARQLAEKIRARQIGPNRWIALCPAHNDRKPSLHIGQGINPHFSQARCLIAVSVGEKRLGKAVFSWHNCVMETQFRPFGGGLSDDRV